MRDPMEQVQRAAQVVDSLLASQGNGLTKASGTHANGAVDGGAWSAPEYATTVELVRGSEVTIRAVPWLWYEWMTAGGLTILAGRPSTGKTTVALTLAATVTTGGKWPDGTKAEVGNVCIWSGEDDPAYTLIPRLALAGADLSRVFCVGDVRRVGTRDAFDPARDMEPLRRALLDAGGCRLLIVDPIVSAISGDSHKNAEVRRGLQPLCDLASGLGCALLGITHLSKGTDGRDPTERLTGSLAFGALARTVLMTAKSKGEDGTVTRLLLRAKNNLGADDGGFAYDIEQGDVPNVEGVQSSRVVWGDAIDGDARELLAEAESVPEQAGDSLGEAGDWLVSYLRDRGGHATRKEVLSAALSAGFAERTIQRARERLRITTEQHGFGADKRSTWSLPDALMPANHANNANPRNLCTHGTNGTYGDHVEVDL